MPIGIMLLVMLVQTGTLAQDWIRLTTGQAKPSTVLKLRGSPRPALITCREVVFESTGLDLITESQFTLVVIAVVDRGGHIQRFRIVHKPSFKIDFTSALRDALGTWQYDAMKPEQRGHAFETTITLPKLKGAVQTSACQESKHKR